MCAISPEVVDLPLVPVIVTICFFTYLEQYFKKSGQIFSASIPANDVPDDLLNSLIARYALFAVINAG